MQEETSQEKANLDLPGASTAEGFEECLVEPEDALAPISFEELPESIKESVLRAGWSSLMPVQARAIPYILAGRDLMVQSRTGSGKTGAFLLPILDRIDPDLAHCQTLILVPTRELAQQVYKAAEELCAGTGINTVAVYGGVGYGPQLDAFKKGAHLVVGTPGRLLDHLQRGSYDVGHLRFLVFDEADRLLSMGFYPDMRKVRSYLPETARQGYMFSATFPTSVQRLAREFLNEPDFLSLSRDQVHVSSTEHIVYQVPAMDKDRALIRSIEMENPTAAIIFCNTKAMVHYIHVVMKRFGYDVADLTSDLAQNAREKVLQRVRDKKLRFIVATDVAARGIDIDHLSHVYMYEVPDDPETYIHRSGRTGRAGASGRSIALVSGIEVFQLDRIAKRYKMEMEKETVPSNEDVQEIVSERVVALLEARLRDRDKLQAERAQRFLPLARELADSDDELVLVAMLLDDYYQKMLHAPPEMPTAKNKGKKGGGAKPPMSGKKEEKGSENKAQDQTESKKPADGQRRKRRRNRGGNN